jgi:hypothetical protein
MDFCYVPIEMTDAISLTSSGCAGTRCGMRISVTLQGELLNYVRQRATAEQRTMASIIEDALRRERALNVQRRPVRLPVFGRRGMRPGVNLDNTAELLDRMADPR